MAKEFFGEPAAVYLQYHLAAKQTGNSDVPDVAPISLRVHRGIDVHDRRTVTYDRCRELKRTDEQADQLLRRGLFPSFAAGLKMHEAEVFGNRRAEEKIRMRTHSANRRE